MFIRHQCGPEIVSDWEGPYNMYGPINYHHNFRGEYIHSDSFWAQDWDNYYLYLFGA